MSNLEQLKIISKLIRPILRYAVKNSIKIQSIYEILKIELTNIAKELLIKNKEKITDSRLSIITGIHRKEITKLTDDNIEIKLSTPDKLTKILGLWQSNEKYTTKQGKPKTLSYKGDNNDFTTLVYEVSKELNPAAILFELERINAIERSERGLNLIKESFVPTGNFEESLNIVSKDIGSLIAGATKNILNKDSTKNLHVRTSFDNIRPEYEEEIKQWLLKEGHKFHSHVRNYLSQFDQDINPDPKFKDKGISISISSISNTEDINE